MSDNVDNGDGGRHAQNDDGNDETAPVEVQEPENPPPQRPFIAHNLRRFSPVVVLAWLVFMLKPCSAPSYSCSSNSGATSAFFFAASAIVRAISMVQQAW